MIYDKVTHKNIELYIDSKMLLFGKILYWYP